MSTLKLMANDNGLESITESTKLWTPKLNIALPISSLDIDDFRQWVNWRGYNEDHKGYDFFAYANEDGTLILGLPQNTRIRAIADGIIRTVFADLEPLEIVAIEHGKIGSGLMSRYGHIFPLVKEGMHIKKGDVIGTLCNNPKHIQKYGGHLHFALHHLFEGKPYSVDPSKIYTSLR